SSDLSCKKQTIVANSTTKAEYVAAANCCGQVLWIQNQMMDYGFNFMNTKIHIDNESTISVIKNHTFSPKDLMSTIEGRQDDLLESLERDIDGTKELLLPDMLILWLTKVSTDNAKLVPLGKDSTAIKPLEKIPPRV
ncbi:hypothetical protein Tco_0098733, partial [Tanacetum coccineum]